jgi:hypothetical protein
LSTRRAFVRVNREGHILVVFHSDAFALWEGMRAGFLDVRPRGEADRAADTFPETTHADVIRIVEIWARAYTSDYVATEDASGVAESWLPYVRELADALKGADPDATFPGNREFWKRSRRLALRLSTMREPASGAELFVGRLVDAVTSYEGTMLALSMGGLPQAAGAGAHAIHRAGAAVNSAVRGAAETAWNAVKLIAIVGVVGLGAAVVVPRILAVRSQSKSGGAA